MRDVNERISARSSWGSRPPAPGQAAAPWSFRESLHVRPISATRPSRDRWWRFDRRDSPDREDAAPGVEVLFGRYLGLVVVLGPAGDVAEFWRGEEGGMMRGWNEWVGGRMFLLKGGWGFVFGWLLVFGRVGILGGGFQVCSVEMWKIEVFEVVLCLTWNSEYSDEFLLGS